MNGLKNCGPYNIFAEVEKTVEFYECDPLGVVWHGNYLDYFEIGRRKLLEKIGYDYYEMQKTGFAFPVTGVNVKYCGILRFKDHAVIRAILEEYENCLKIKYEIRNAQTGVVTTKGIVTQMALNMKTNESCFVCPKVFQDKVEAVIKESKKGD